MTTLKLFIAYFSVFAISLAAFWFFLSGIDAGGYAILFFYIINPIAIVIVSFAASKTTDTRKALLFSVLLGLLYMLLGYFTFDLLNMITYDRLLFPPIMMWIEGLILALAGYLLGKAHERWGISATS